MEYKEKQTPAQTKQQKAKNKEQRSKGMVVLPCIKGTTEAVQRVLKKHGIGSSDKPDPTLRQLLVHPKDKIDQSQKSEDMHQIPCKNCRMSFIRETGRKFNIRLKEHRSEADKGLEYIYTRSTRRQSEK